MVKLRIDLRRNILHFGRQIKILAGGSHAD